MDNEMMFVLAKAALVLLAGVYAIRATSFLFLDEPFEPLTLVAALAFVVSIIVFYRPPTAPGLWLYVVVALCVIGAAANALLLVAPDESHRDPTNLVFSAISIAGWALVGLSYSLLLLRAR
jgi:hypothetical protein